MIHRFGEFDLDEGLFELRRAGQVVPMQRRAFDLLTYLVRHSDVVVSKADLAKNVWLDVVVAKDALPHAMMMVRNALGDDVDNPMFIHTIRGRGYRFVAAVERLSSKTNNNTNNNNTNNAKSSNNASTGDDAGMGAPPASAPMLAAAAQPLAASSRREQVLIARSASMAVLRDRVHSAIVEGLGGLVLVTGDPGIGKTRLLEDLIGKDHAPARLISVRCYAGIGAPDLWPFTQALRELHALGVAERSEGLRAFALSRGVGAGGGAGGGANQPTSDLSSSGRDDATNGHSSHGGGVGVGRDGALKGGDLVAEIAADKWFGIFDDVINTLAKATEREPLLLLIDDLDLADARSLELLRLLAPRLRSLRMLVIAAHRPAASDGGSGGGVGGDLKKRSGTLAHDTQTHRATTVLAPHIRVPSFNTTVGALASEPSTCVVTLDPFTRAEVALYLEQVLPKPPAPSVIDKVFEKTKGNPLFVSQLVHVLRAEERLRAEEVATSSLVGNENMREAIVHHVSSLPESVVRTLTMAAVFGRMFPLAPLAAALETTNADVLRDLDAASAARVVSTSDPGSYRFTYPLVRDVLYKRLTASDRARLHGLAANALEEHLIDDADHPSVGRIAAHLTEAAQAGEVVDRALDWSLKAIELAERAGDDAAAIAYAQRGLTALQFARKPDASKRARFLAVTSRRS